MQTLKSRSARDRTYDVRVFVSQLHACGIVQQGKGARLSKQLDRIMAAKEHLKQQTASGMTQKYFWYNDAESLR